MKTERLQTNTIDAYIEGFPEVTRRLLKQIRMAIRMNAPEASERISYGMPTFYFNGNLVHFAAFKNHIGFFPTPSAIEAFEKELRGYKTSKGTVQLPIDDPMPIKLIARMVKFRVKENAQKAKG